LEGYQEGDLRLSET